MGSRTSCGGNAGALAFFQEVVEHVAEYIRYEIRLYDRQEKGRDLGATLEEAALRGDKEAQDLLESAVSFPEAGEYMYDWVRLLHGRSGVGMGGAVRLSPTIVKDWETTFDIQDLQPWHVEALMYLDDVIIDAHASLRGKKEPTSNHHQPPGKKTGLRSAQIPWPKSR